VVARVALLCVVESVIVLLLALQVFASQVVPGDGTQSPVTHGQQPEPRSISEVAPGEIPSPSLAKANGARSRKAVVAKYRADDPVGVLLTGSLRLRDGGPAEVSIGATLGKERRYTSSEHGSFALTGLHPGDWRVTLRGDSIVQSEHTLTITDDAVQYRDFVLDPSHPVRVMIVTPDGKDATRALRLTMSGWNDFRVAGQKAAFPERLAPTDYGAVFVGDARWKGEMNPREGFAGTLHLNSVPAHVALLQRHIVLEQKIVNPGQKEVKFVVDVAALKELAASATVHVLDAGSGAPLTMARVSLGTSNRSGRRRKVDEEGRAVLEGLSPGFLLCRISAREHESYFHTVLVEPGQRLDLGDVRLGPSLPLAGKVLGPDGKPAGARMTWTELKWRSTPAGFAHNRSARTQADGSFSLGATGRGRIAVQARGKDGMMAAGVFENPPVTPIVMRLTKPSTCTVTRPPDPTRMFIVTLFDPNKRAILARAVEPRNKQMTLSLPAGNYTFEVHDDRGDLVQTGALSFGSAPCKLVIR